MKDKRYTINKLSESEFTISISSVTFKDGGNYTCSQYAHNTIEKKVEVTVLGEYFVDGSQTILLLKLPKLNEHFLIL